MSVSLSENYICETKEFDMKEGLTVISKANCLCFPNLRPTPKKKKEAQKYILTPSGKNPKKKQQQPIVMWSYLHQLLSLFVKGEV